MCSKFIPCPLILIILNMMYLSWKKACGISSIHVCSYLPSLVVENSNKNPWFHPESSVNGMSLSFWTFRIHSFVSNWSLEFDQQIVLIAGSKIILKIQVLGWSLSRYALTQHCVKIQWFIYFIVLIQGVKYKQNVAGHQWYIRIVELVWTSQDPVWKWIKKEVQINNS